MSTQRNPIDLALDVFVFAPLGATIEFWDKMPDRARLGRERLGSQAPAARMIGEFAVKAGRQKVEARVDELAAAGRRRAGAASPSTAPAEPIEAALVESALVETANVEDAHVDAGAVDAGAVDAGTAVAVELAIDDYDGLPAVQIIPMLATLSADERVAIRAHEVAGLGRRTILGKLDQLDASGAP